jgi:hypothetical protein
MPQERLLIFLSHRQQPLPSRQRALSQASG